MSITASRADSHARRAESSRSNDFRFGSLLPAAAKRFTGRSYAAPDSRARLLV
jgi:hypothetical protein